MKDFIEFLNKEKEGIIHLTVFWRIVLFPIFFWWFLFQLFVFSFCCGTILVVMGIFSMIFSFESSNWRLDFRIGLDMVIAPFVSPFIWLYKYFVLGEFNTLMND